MDPIKQRIAIAEACGWKPINMGSLPTAWKHPTTPANVDVGRLDVINSRYLPDYLNDLNAMHEAEKVLGKPLCYHYVDHLPKHLEGRTNFALAHATAAQRAEAFLRTLNLWTTET